MNWSLARCRVFWVYLTSETNVTFPVMSFLVVPVLPRPRREGVPFRAVRQRRRGPPGRPSAPHGDARRRRHLVQALWRRAWLEIREPFVRFPLCSYWSVFTAYLAGGADVYLVFFSEKCPFECPCPGGAPLSFSRTAKLGAELPQLSRWPVF